MRVEHKVTKACDSTRLQIKGLRLEPSCPSRTRGSISLEVKDLNHLNFNNQLYEKFPQIVFCVGSHENSVLLKWRTPSFFCSLPQTLVHVWSTFVSVWPFLHRHSVFTCRPRVPPAHTCLLLSWPRLAHRQANTSTDVNELRNNNHTHTNSRCLLLFVASLCLVSRGHRSSAHQSASLVAAWQPGKSLMWLTVAAGGASRVRPVSEAFNTETSIH